MKKNIAFLALSFISLSLVSCSSDKDEVVSPQEPKKVHVSFDITSRDSEVTRAGLDPNRLGIGTTDMYWEENDEIGVSADNDDYPEFCPIKVSEVLTETNKAKAEGEVRDTKTGWLCVYPKSNSAFYHEKQGPKTVIINLPNAQNIETGHNISKEAFYQVGYTTSTKTLNMETPCSFLVFQTTGHEIKQVEVSALDEKGGEYSIAGCISVTKTETSGFTEASGNVIEGYPSYNKVTCTYNYGEVFPEGNFAIAIRPGSPHKLEVKVTFSDNTEKTYTTTKLEGGANLTFYRANYHMFPAFPK